MLAGFANAVILMFVAFNIVLEAAVHVMVGGHDVTTHRLLPVSIAGLAVNLIGLLFVHEAHHHHLPTQQQHSHQGSASTGGRDIEPSGATQNADPPQVRLLEDRPAAQESWCLQSAVRDQADAGMILPLR